MNVFVSFGIYVAGWPFTTHYSLLGGPRFSDFTPPESHNSRHWDRESSDIEIYPHQTLTRTGSVVLVRTSRSRPGVLFSYEETSVSFRTLITGLPPFNLRDFTVLFFLRKEWFPSERRPLPSVRATGVNQRKNYEWISLYNENVSLRIRKKKKGTRRRIIDWRSLFIELERLGVKGVAISLSMRRGVSRHHSTFTRLPKFFNGPSILRKTLQLPET